MKKTKNNPSFAPASGEYEDGSVSLHPHYDPKQPFRAVFGFDGHITDTIALAVRRMKPPSKPQVNRSNPNDIFIYWNHDVPVELWHLHKRKRERVKKRDDLNSYSGEKQEKQIDFRLKVWAYCLDHLRYNPFEEELNEYRRLKAQKSELIEQIEVEENLTIEETRLSTPIDKALLQFINSRIKRKLASVTISAYQSSVDWLNFALLQTGYGQLTIGQIKHIHLSEALDYTAEEREWSATTINKEVGRLMTIFNWLEIEEYIIKNPSKGKFIDLPTNKSMHTWYDRDTKTKVKEELLNANKINVYRAMQFTYWILIRSKSELRKLRIGDIDTVLKRVRFSSELSKNSSEQYRDYPVEFQQVINDMKIAKLPREWFVFGSKTGLPGPEMVSHNFFSKQFKVVKDKIGLSPDYTIYGMKHTRIVHELMKGTDGIEITTMARHSDYKTTRDYMRDYDLTLKNIYQTEDLTF